MSQALFLDHGVPEVSEVAAFMTVCQETHSILLLTAGCQKGGGTLASQVLLMIACGV
jgi:hypothetical protein